VQRKSGLIGKEGVNKHSFPYRLLFPKMSTGPSEKKGLKNSPGDEFFR
jgi:hypothetical protein